MSKPLPREDLDHILTQAREPFRELSKAHLFITGGTGFFGHWLLESLLYADRELSLGIRASVLTRSISAFSARSPYIAHHPSITLCEGDIRSFEFPADLEQDPFTHIVHAATDSGGQQAARPAYELAESILEGTRRVLHLARLKRNSSRPLRLLYTSSGAVYGRSTTLLHTPETYTGASDPLLLQSSYDEAKRMSEHLCIAYAHESGSAATASECRLEPVIARCFAFVGPHLALDQHFAIGNFIGAALAKRPVHIRGDGTPRRSWLYMADLAIWLWTMLVRGEAGRAYNVGSDEAYTIAQAAHLTAATLSPGLPVQIDGVANPNAPLNSYVPAIQRARTELGLRVTIPLAEALRRTAAWHQA